MTPAQLELISQFSASCWEDRTAVRCESSSFSCGIVLFDFCWVAMVPSGKGGGAAAVGDHEFVESASFVTNKVPPSADA